jgi:hypothetical protein
MPRAGMGGRRGNLVFQRAVQTEIASSTPKAWRTPKKTGTDTSRAFAAKGYFGGVSRSERRAATCLYPFS